MKRKKIIVDINSEELRNKLNIKDGYTPVKGVDYFDGKDAEFNQQEVVEETATVVVERVKPLIPTIDEVVEDLPKFGEKTRDGLELLNGADRLSRNAIDGLDDYEEVSKLAREKTKIKPFVSRSGGNILETPISLSNGGWGITNTRSTFSTSGVQNALTVSGVWIVFTGPGASVINGITAQVDGIEIIITNGGSGTLVINNQNTSASAANRIIGAEGGVNMTVGIGSSVRLRYDGSISRWRVVAGYPYASISNGGIITSAMFNTWQGKVSGSGSTNGVAYFNSNTNVTTDIAGFSFDPALDRVGVQTETPDSVLQVKNTVGTVVGDIGSGSTSLIAGNTINDITGASASQVTGYMPKASSFSSTINYGSGNYTADGAVRDYVIYQGFYDGDSTYMWAVVDEFTTQTDDNSFNSYYVSIGWSPVSGLANPNIWRVYRQVNGGGYSEYYETFATFFNDGDGSISWTGGSPAPTPTYPDYVANETNRNYVAYQIGISPSGATVYSQNGYGYGFVDNNSDDAFIISHSVSNNPVRIIGSADGSSADSYIDSLDTTLFTEQEDSWTAGTTVTPNSYGIQSDGSALNREYYVYAYRVVDGTTIYSSNGYYLNTTDPNDSQYYYIQLSWGVATDAEGYVVTRNINGSGYNDYKTIVGGGVTTLYDDALTSWTSGSFTNSPNAVYPVTLKVHQATTKEGIRIVSSAGDQKGEILIYSNDESTIYGGIRSIQGIGDMYIGQGGTVGDTSKGWVKFNSSETRINGNGSIVFDSTGTTKFQVTSSQNISSQQLTMSDGSNISVGTSSGTKIGTSTSQKLSVWNATPNVQPTNAITAAAFVTNTSGTLNDSATFGGYTIGQVVAALKRVGILA